MTSTWRFYDNYIDCLRNGGLRPGVNVLGKTPVLPGLNNTRGKEIKAYLIEHPEVERFIIFDDEDDVDELGGHLILCNTNRGFGVNEYYKAVRMDEMMENERSLFHEGD